MDKLLAAYLKLTFRYQSGNQIDESCRFVGSQDSIWTVATDAALVWKGLPRPVTPAEVRAESKIGTVSYTHLTLPTIYSV